MDLAPVRAAVEALEPRGAGLREGLRSVSTVRPRRRWSADASCAQLNKLLLQSERKLGNERRAAAARLVQASDLRARLLHRLRREDDAADPRRAGREPAG